MIMASERLVPLPAVEWNRCRIYQRDEQGAERLASPGILPR